METVNQTPYVTATLPQTGPGEKPGLTVIVKGTFDIRPEESAVAASDQIPMGYGDELYDPDSGGSVKFESDMAPFKPRADVVLVGHAHARGQQQVNALDVSLRVGPLTKKLRVTGNRQWKWIGRLLPVSATQPELFTKMPIVYEKAFGGIDAEGGGFCRENLSGQGFITKKLKKLVAGVPLPNIEDPDNLISSWKDRPFPAGFGFFGRAWHPRQQHIGTYDDVWRKERSPRPPLDFSFEYHNAAHPDLQSREYLKGDEKVELINLTPAGRLSFRLPGVRIHCTAGKSYDLSAIPGIEGQDMGKDEENPLLTEPVEMNLDTLCLIPDEMRFFMVWRGICPVADLTAIEVKKIKVTQVLRGL